MAINQIGGLSSISNLIGGAGRLGSSSRLRELLEQLLGGNSSSGPNAAAGGGGCPNCGGKCKGGACKCANGNCKRCRGIRG